MSINRLMSVPPECKVLLSLTVKTVKMLSHVVSMKDCIYCIYTLFGQYKNVFYKWSYFLVPNLCCTFSHTNVSPYQIIACLNISWMLVISVTTISTQQGIKGCRKKECSRKMHKVIWKTGQYQQIHPVEKQWDNVECHIKVAYFFMKSIHDDHRHLAFI